MLLLLLVSKVGFDGRLGTTRNITHSADTTHCCEASVGLQDFISRWCASLLPQVRAPDALLRNAAEGEKILVPVEEAPREAEEGMAE